MISFLQGCGPLESVSGNQSKTYKQDFNTMINTVEKAIRGRSLEINFTQKSDDGNRYFVTFHSTSYVNTQNQRRDQGEIIIERIGDNETKITINNPEYEPTTPSHHREKYDKELIEEIERILKQ
ncbi:hypothetical protein [Fodinibius sp.]|uniref:hypothetical protein n=1 Tax=Fodinibius sp. TaxID=1872440 RepID=UPI002ACE80C6|nr:hypothetical protein [Fodinibius sp.]MDZ7659912.1 hypothetical protein [Fodinibius sp.]